MNRLLLLSILVFSFLTLSGQTNIPYSSSQKEIDGNLTDWCLKKSSEFVVKHVSPFNSNHVLVNTAWDEQCLYLAFRVYDKSINVVANGNENPELYRNDCIEFYIDPLNDSKNRMDINDYQFIFDAGGNYAILKGDKEKISIPGYRVPKEIGTATIAFSHSIKVFGKINSASGDDSMYVIEVALPWAAMGVVPKTGYAMKMDFCNNDPDCIGDIDTVKKNYSAINLVCTSIKGEHDYGFPDRWLTITLTGGPGLFENVIKKNYGWWLSFLFIIFIGSLFVILRQYRLISQLRAIPRKEDLNNESFIQMLSEAKNAEDTRIQKNSDKNAELISGLKDFVLKNINQNITAEDLAKKSGYTLRHIQRIFKEELNANPKTFITLLKIEEAARMLKSSNQTVSEVAHSIGFSDPSYFSKVFRKYFNISPTDFSRN